MPKLLKELDADPVARLPGQRQVLRSPIAPVVIQYWRSFEELEAYAARADPQGAVEALLRARQGRRRHRHLARDLRVRAGEYECVYGNMPRFGLAAAAGHRGSARPRVRASASARPASRLAPAPTGRRTGPPPESPSQRSRWSPADGAFARSRASTRTTRSGSAAWPRDHGVVDAAVWRATSAQSKRSTCSEASATRRSRSSSSVSTRSTISPSVLGVARA